MRKKLHLLKILRDFVDSKYENNTWKKKPLIDTQEKKTENERHSL